MYEKTFKMLNDYIGNSENNNSNNNKQSINNSDVLFTFLGLFYVLQV